MTRGRGAAQGRCGILRDTAPFLEREDTEKGKDAHLKSARAGPSRILKDNEGYFERFEPDPGLGAADQARAPGFRKFLPSLPAC